MITAKKVYKDILQMPVSEREKLFATIARKGFEKDLYTHDEVFGDIRKSPFSLKEAAEINVSNSIFIFFDFFRDTYFHLLSPNLRGAHITLREFFFHWEIAEI